MGEILHTADDTAKMLGMSKKTLLEHVRYGNIRCISLGVGKRRIHRRFTDQNIQTFLKKQKLQGPAQCPSPSQLKAHSINTTSNSTVVAFSAVPKPGPKKKLK